MLRSGTTWTSDRAQRELTFSESSYLHNMVVKGSGHFRFIVTHSGKVRGRSRREFELAQSDAKSHAARVAYDRKRKQDGPPYQQDDVKQDSEWTKQVILIDQDAFFVDTGFLDPFLRLANVISLEERNLLHECEYFPILTNPTSFQPGSRPYARTCSRVSHQQPISILSSTGCNSGSNVNQ